MWSLRGNMCEIPTDCPHRERAGWTGDWQIFAPTAAFLYDVDAFTRKWLADVRLAQARRRPDRQPRPVDAGRGLAGPAAALHGSAGWGDVIVLVPWALYEAYGDPAPLAECWDAMERWVAYGERSAREWALTGAHGRATRSGAPRAVPVGHRVPLGRMARARLRDRRLRRVRRRRQVGGRDGLPAPVGGDDGADRRGARPATRRSSDTDGWPHGTLDAWQTGVHRRRRLAGVQTQASHVRALTFGLVPDELRGADRRPARRARPRRRHDRRDRLPLDRHAAAGARRARPPRPRLRAPAPAERARLDVHDRPRCDDGVGALGTASTTTACRTSRSTTTARARWCRSCIGTPPGSSHVARLPHVRGPATTRWRDHAHQRTSRHAGTAASTSTGTIAVAGSSSSSSCPPAPRRQ